MPVVRIRILIGTTVVRIRILIGTTVVRIRILIGTTVVRIACVVLETPFDIHVSSVYQTHTCIQAPIPTLCISAKKTHNKGSRTRPIMSTLMPRSGIPVICSRATLSCDSSYLNMLRNRFFHDTAYMIAYWYFKLSITCLCT